METMEYVSLREAAELLGITLRAVRGRVKSRNVPLVTVAGKHGDRYLLQRDHLTMLADEEGWTVPTGEATSSRGDWSMFKAVPGEGYQAPPPPEGTVPEEESPTVSETVPGDGPAVTVGIPVSVHRAALDTARKAIEAAQEAQARADDAQDRSQKLERATYALQMELTQYRRALTDQAESLAEREALARQAAEQQARLVELAAAEAERVRLLEEQTREAERLAEALRQAEGRASKVPGWVRRLFGA